ncbi:sugar ABC transporter ATP-binding protein [Arthrobacter globiformis NBRC 12137]|uniref:Sugar ABC transporter ATP-binding protein n=1 Tax=Arthrobacter globiformis (strain ATCC 8010 / DSM 20124 / JCM 1332 / NBRC 12137 / NCIMB 8907 / NRRL B-2979 / 168) TaxID=1077972 RepID=H0QPP5_ARTG1|nr:sugar ABC transporter ATP-binding protein [Arthrobacter globiformis NBRC 12137]
MSGDQPSQAPTPPAPAERLVEVSGLRKTYGTVQALRGVEFELAPGEVHALLGENGAGKSTLIKVLAGVESSDAGTLKIFGEEKSFRSPAESRAAGLAVVYQELSQVPSLTVAANIFLGREPRTAFGAVKQSEIMSRTKAFLAEYGFPLDPRAVVGDLPFAYRQMTEIAKALMSNVRVLVLDEPTSALSEGEEEVLFDAVRKVTARGVGVIYVTHRLGEVFKLSQRVTVFRDGLRVGTYPTSDMDMKSLVSAIIGPRTMAAEVADAVQGHGPKQDHVQRATGSVPALAMSGVGDQRLRGVDLEVQSGEIMGLAGVIGSGRTEILETVFGLRRPRQGQLQIHGQPFKPAGPVDAIRAGVGLVPEDRHGQGLVMDDSIERNIALPRLKPLTRLGFFSRKGAAERSHAAMKELSIKAQNRKTVVGTLSGGNQQKVVFGKWREPRCELLLLDEPTVGVDVGAREEIYGVIRQAAASGTAVLVVSSDLSELLLLCQRITIVRDGRTIRTIHRDEVDSEEALHHLVHTSSPVTPGVPS